MGLIYIFCSCSKLCGIAQRFVGEEPSETHDAEVKRFFPRTSTRIYQTVQRFKLFVMNRKQLKAKPVIGNETFLLSSNKIWLHFSLPGLSVTISEIFSILASGVHVYINSPDLILLAGIFRGCESFPLGDYQRISIRHTKTWKFISSHQFCSFQKFSLSEQEKKLLPSSCRLLTSANKRHLSPYLTLQSKAINLEMNPFRFTFHATFFDALRSCCRCE